MKHIILFAALALGACATPGAAPLETKGQEVDITRTEKAITPDQVNAVTPPAPLGPRPADARSAAAIALAQMCRYVGFASKIDLLAQTATGMVPVQRVLEPICDKLKK